METPLAAAPRQRRPETRRRADGVVSPAKTEIDQIELAVTLAKRDRLTEAALDSGGEHERGGERARQVDAELDDLDPDHGLHPAEIGEDDHHRAEQDNRPDDDRRHVRLRLER